MNKLKRSISDAIIFLIVAGLGVLQYGRFVWPVLGLYWNIVNGSVIIGILLAG